MAFEVYWETAKSMVTKTIGTIFIILACIFLFPITIAIIGGVFGIVFGVIGGVFGAIFGVIGGIFGAIGGILEWIFDGLFGWHGSFGFWNCSPFSIFVLALIVALLLRSRTNNQQRKHPK